MLEKYIDEQPIITKLLLNSIKNNTLVQAYLFISEDKIFLMDYVLSFAKSIISDNDENINKMIDNNTYPELKIINPKNNIIKKEDMINLQKDFYVKPTLGNKLVYIINGAEKLNSSSANTILKFLEEPNDDVVAILLTDNLANVLPTIKSRCQNLILKNKKNDVIDIKSLYEYYINESDREEYNIEKYLDFINNSINLIELIERTGINSIIHYKEEVFDSFKTKEDYIMLFDFILYFYYDILNFKLERKIVYYDSYVDRIEPIANKNDLESIEKKLGVIENTKIKLNTNMNLKLLLDDFVIKFSEV